MIFDQKNQHFRFHILSLFIIFVCGFQNWFIGLNSNQGGVKLMMNPKIYEFDAVIRKVGFGIDLRLYRVPI